MKTQYGVNSKSLNNLLEDVLADTNFFINNGMKKVSKQPPVNIHETETAYELLIMVAGVPKEQIQIETKQKSLVVAYKPEHQEKVATTTILRKEFSVDGFERKFALDEKMDIENINAKYDNGILNITIPKLVSKPTTEKKITIA